MIASLEAAPLDQGCEATTTCTRAATMMSPPNCSTIEQRWYDASSGRWLSQDPIGFTGGTESFAVCWKLPNERKISQRYIVVQRLMGDVPGDRG